VVVTGSTRNRFGGHKLPRGFESPSLRHRLLRGDIYYLSFRTYVRNPKTLKLLESRFLASLRNDIKVNYDTVSLAVIHDFSDE